MCPTVIECGELRPPCGLEDTKMRHPCVVSLVFMLLVTAAARSMAAPLNWDGTLLLEFGDIQPLSIAGGGVTTVNQSSGGVPAHLQTLVLAGSRGGISGTATQPFSAGQFFGTSGTLRIDAQVGTGTLAPISGGVQSTTVLTQNILPVRGLVKVCVFSPQCTNFIPIDLTEPTTMGGAIGFGIGGLLTIGGGTNPLRMSIEAAPWTIKTGTSIDEITTPMSPMGFQKFVNRTAMGFAHGPASLTTSTAQPSGVVQLVTPMQITTNQTFGTASKISLFGVLQVRFIPEPGMLVLLISGALGLAVLGRSRFRE